MCEIKFRAWDAGSKQMWIPFFVTNEGHAGSYSSEAEGPQTYRSHVVMQCTGFKDKNGKDIFEGDVIKFSFHDERDPSSDDEGMGEVFWNTFDARFDVITDGVHMEIWADYDMWTFEVIGNIYENPDLAVH